MIEETDEESEKPANEDDDEEAKRRVIKGTTTKKTRISGKISPLFRTSSDTFNEARRDPSLSWEGRLYSDGGGMAMVVGHLKYVRFGTIRILGEMRDRDGRGALVPSN